MLLSRTVTRPLENGAEYSRLPVSIAFLKETVGVQARQLGARAGAARRTVLTSTRTQNKIVTLSGYASGSAEISM
jgi:hypothetical protein